MRLVLGLLALSACGNDVDLGGTGLVIDGATSRCGELVAPQLEAGCRGCSPASPECQANGCYGGYWCNVNAMDCHAPPDACP